MASSSKNDGDEEKLRRIEMDRLEINAAYDNGFSNDSIDEEAAYSKDSGVKSYSAMNLSELQDKTDRYGFIHEHKLPARLTEIEVKRNKIEKLRERKWLDMLKNWTAYNTSHSKFEKLKSRIFKGIPDSMRNMAWYKLLDIENQIKAQSGVYERMKHLARKHSVDLRQIDLDINRTFRDNLAYKKRYCQRQVQLYNVLAAYSIYNTEIGYCQGMSNIAALLLMYLSDEERTFWALSQLMSHSKYSMHGFFKADFPKLSRFSDKHDSIAKEMLPKLYKKFLKCDITALLYTTKWFLQVFLDALPFSLVLRIWDVYLLKGDIVLLGMSYCILKMHKKILMKKNMDEINEFLKNRITTDFGYDDDVVMRKFEQSLDELKRNKFGGLTKSPFEAIPSNELPTVPFGLFKAPSSKQQEQQQFDSATYHKRSDETSRKQALEKMATVRLESEKRRERDERRERRRRLQMQQAVTNPEDGANLHALVKDGDKPIKNISDDSDSDDDDVSDDDDDDDDLNPSRLSEYEDEKGDKGSVISGMTHQTSSHRSSTDLHLSENSLSSQSKQSLARKQPQRSANIPSNNSFSKRSAASSDYDNQKPASNSSSRRNILNIDDDDDDDDDGIEGISRMKISSDGVRGGQRSMKGSRANEPRGKPGQQRQQSFGKVSAKPLGAMPSQQHADVNKDDGVGFNLNRSTTSMSFSGGEAATARIESNPPPISPSNYVMLKTSASSFDQQHYFRSPNGIYTRMQANRSSTKTALPPNLMQHSASNAHIIGKTKATTSMSSMMNSSVGTPASVSNGGQQQQQQQQKAGAVSYAMPLNVSTKRTSSLRSIQKQLSHHQLSNYAGGRDTAAAQAAQAANLVRQPTPTKLQLHNHSLRIASIQQQQQQQQQQIQPHNHHHHQVHNSNFSIISQAPSSTNNNNNNNKQYHVHSPPPLPSSSSPTVLTQYKLLNTNDLMPPTPPSSIGELNGSGVGGDGGAAKHPLKVNGSKLKTTDIEQFDYI